MMRIFAWSGPFLVACWIGALFWGVAAFRPGEIPASRTFTLQAAGRLKT
jgi:hypothetical protein